MDEKKIKCSYKKPRLVPGKALLKEDQEGYILSLLYEATKARLSNGKNVFLFFDPTHSVHNSEVAKCWQFKGKEGRKQIKSNTGKRRVNILSALDINTLDLTTIITEDNCDRLTMIMFLEELRRTYGEQIQITLVIDNASYNRAYEVQDAAFDLGIKLIYLPQYSPNLNIIERLWKYFKKKVIKNKYYETFESFYQAMEKFFKDFKYTKQDLATLLNLNFEILNVA